MSFVQHFIWDTLCLSTMLMFLEWLFDKRPLLHLLRNPFLTLAGGAVWAGVMGIDRVNPFTKLQVFGLFLTVLTCSIAQLRSRLWERDKISILNKDSAIE